MINFGKSGKITEYGYKNAAFVNPRLLKGKIIDGV